MYKKVLYNIKKMKKCGAGGGGAIFEKNFTKYSTHHSLSANIGFKSLAFILFEILHLQNCDVKFQNFHRAITQKKSYEFFFKISPYNLLIVLYQLLKVPSPL